MTQPDQNTLSNRLLRAMTPVDYGLLAPHLERIATELHQVLISPRAVITHVFFPESGFVSATTDGPGRVEIGLVGREGLVGVAATLGDDRTPYEHFVQSPGEVIAIEVKVLLSVLETSHGLGKLLARYAHTFLIQTAHTAFVNASYGIEIRLVRWLLMCQDRLGGTELPLTHEYLSMMLGVQRTSVTLSLQMLEGIGLIRARRGRIEIRDRERMLLAADKAYGEPEAAYDRLIAGRDAPLLL